MVMHDWWILLSAMHENTTVLYIDLPLVAYRQHSGNVLGYKKNNIFILVIRLLFKIPTILVTLEKLTFNLSNFTINHG